MRCNPWLVKLPAGMSLLYYPAIFYLDKWTLDDSAAHFTCKCIIQQNSDTLVIIRIQWWALNNSKSPFFVADELVKSRTVRVGIHNNLFTSVCFRILTIVAQQLIFNPRWCPVADIYNHASCSKGSWLKFKKKIASLCWVNIDLLPGRPTNLQPAYHTRAAWVELYLLSCHNWCGCSAEEMKTLASLKWATSSQFSATRL